MKKLRVALLQIEAKLGDVEGNGRKIMEFLLRAEEEGAQLAVTPELAMLGFGSGDIYLDKVDENLYWMSEILRLSKDLSLWACVGFVEKHPVGFFHNACALIHRGEIKGIHRKVQLVNYRLFDEKRYFHPGKRVDVFETDFGKIGILICEDIWFPEPPRILAFKGANLIVVLSASPYSFGKVEIWESYLRARTYDNILPIVFANLCGVQDGVMYWGGSMAFSASGKKLGMAKLFDEDLLVVDIDLDEAQRLRRRDIRLRETRKETLEELIKSFEEMEEL